jgi:predicted amidohydrolase
MLENKIKSIKEKTHIVILPEMFSTGFSKNAAALAETMDGQGVEWMRRISIENKIILTGSIIIEEEGKYYNRLIWMQPNGNFGYYDKRHLFAYAEEDKYYTAGNKRFIATVNGWKINLQICYDLRFPVWARQQSTENEESFNPEYDIVIYVANWPERRSVAWKSLLTARAIENQSYVVGVNRVGKDIKEINHSGNSMIIDPLGEVLYHKENDEDIFTITLEKENLDTVRKNLPFLKDGDSFSILN